MATATRTWSFASDSEGLLDGGLDSAITFAALTTDGNPSGCVHFTCVTKAHSGTEKAEKGTPGDTFASLFGIGSGDVITSIRLLSGYDKVAAVSKLSSHNLTVYLVDDTDTAFATLLNTRNPGTSTTAWVAIPAQSGVSVSKTGADTMRLRTDYTVSTGGGGGSASVDYRFDEITVEVTYSAGITNNDSGSGTITLSGSSTQSLSSAGSGTGTLTLSGSGVESYHPPGITNNDSGSGTISLSGSGSGSQLRTGSGSGSLALSGSASESQTGSASRSGSLALGGSGTQSSTHTRSGAGTISLSGSGLELFQPPGDTGTGTITLSGSATPSFVHSSSGTGTINLSGTRLDSQAGSRTGNGTITLSGSGSQSSGDTTWVKSDHVPLGAVISHQGR